MSDYNLDDATESFKFTLGGKAYVMRYPTTEEVEAAPKIEDTNKTTPEEAEAMSTWMYSFITPEQPDSPPIEEAMKKVNVKVRANFNKMIKAEFNPE